MVTRKRIPKGNKDGGQFAPDLTGKNPPAGKETLTLPVPSGDTPLTHDAYQRQLDALTSQGLMASATKPGASVEVEEVIARLSPAEWRAVYQHAAKLNHDAGYSQGYEVGRDDGYVQARLDAVGNVGALIRFDPEWEDLNDPYVDNQTRMVSDPAGEYVLISDVLGAVELPQGAVDTDEDAPL